MTTTLQLGLLLLIFVAMLFLIVIGIYLVKLIIDLNKLANNLNDTTCMVKKEIEPLLEELKTTLTNINSVAKSADDKFNTIRKILTTVFNILMMCIIFFFRRAFCRRYGKNVRRILQRAGSRLQNIRKKIITQLPHPR